MDQAWSDDGESLLDARPPRVRIHQRAMCRRVDRSHKTRLIHRQSKPLADGAGDHRRLVETTFALSFGMKRHRDDARRMTQRFASRDGDEQFSEPRAELGRTFQFEHGSTQRAIIQANGARSSELFRRAVTAPTNVLPLQLDPALGAQRVIYGEDGRSVPTFGARGPIRACFHARPAKDAPVRVRHSKQRVATKTDDAPSQVHARLKNQALSSCFEVMRFRHLVRFVAGNGGQDRAFALRWISEKPMGFAPKIGRSKENASAAVRVRMSLLAGRSVRLSGESRRFRLS